MGGMWMSPLPADSPGGGSNKPWWDFPVGTGGPPKHQHIPGACYQQKVALNGETFGAPVNCGPLFSEGHVFTDDSAIEAWLQWSWGSEDNPGS